MVRLAIGTFCLAQSGTFHLAATKKLSDQPLHVTQLLLLSVAKVVCGSARNFFLRSGSVWRYGCGKPSD
jgi:hypothetical protein